MNRFTLVVACALFGADSGMALSYADETIDLPTLAAALRSELSSIASIEVKYEKIFHDPKRQTPSAEEIEWAEQGDWRLLTRFRKRVGRQPASLMFDGTSWNSYTWDPAGERPGRITTGNALAGSYWSASIPAQFIGSRVAGGQSLPELMQLPEAELVGRENFDGHACWKVHIPIFQGRAGEPHQLAAFLDPEYGFLPVQITVRVADGHQDSEPLRRYFRTWTIHEFMRVKDGTTAALRWFPKEMTLDQVGNKKHTYRVASVQINRPIGIDRFRPHAPDGTVVTDLSALGGARIFVQGGNPASDSLAQRAARDALDKLRAQPPNSLPGMDARPRPPANAAYIVFTISIFVCAFAGVKWFLNVKRGGG